MEQGLITSQCESHLTLSSVTTDSNRFFHLYNSGIARGCGWQHVGAYVNLGAYYLVATPLAVLLCFVLHLGSKGLWTGLLIGNVAQVTSFAVITALTNWQKQVLLLHFLSHLSSFLLLLPVCFSLCRFCVLVLKFVSFIYN